MVLSNSTTSMNTFQHRPIEFTSVYRNGTEYYNGYPYPIISATATTGEFFNVTCVLRNGYYHSVDRNGDPDGRLAINATAVEHLFEA